MNTRRAPCAFVIALLAAACQMTSAQADQPALLTNPGAEVQQELSTAIGRLTGFSSVVLSAQDFTQSSELLVERKPQTDNKGELIQGRNLEMPQRFLLISSDGKCWLVHQNSGQRSLLVKARCR